MGIVDLLNIPRLSDPQRSPGGKDVIYTRADADWKAGRRVSHIWRAPLDGGQPVQLTSGADGENDPRWSPDGKTIAFTAKRGDDEFAQIYLLPSDGGEARRLTTHASAVSELTWSRDGSSIFFKAAEAKSAEDKAREKARDDVYLYDENYKQTHVWNVASRFEGREPDHRRRFFRDGVRTVGRRPQDDLPSRADAAARRRRQERSLGVQRRRHQRRAGDAKHRTGDRSGHLARQRDRCCSSPDRTRSSKPYYNGRLFVAPAGGGAARAVVGETEPIDVDRAIWSKDGKSIYFLANLGVHEELFVVPASGGKPRQITNGKHSLSGLSLADGSDIFTFIAANSHSGGDVWTMAAGDTSPKQITHVFDYLGRDIKLGEQEAIQWKGADGVTVEGIVTYPVDYVAGRKYPLAVMTHGGPQAADKYSVGSMSYEIQVLAGKGYVSLQPNYRGSTGYGDAFLRDMVGHYFQNAHLDVLAGVDELIRRGVADPDRMVKMGWSAGGHMTNKVITVTDRFKAASTGAGVAQWMSMYAQSDIRSYRTPWFGGTPWQKDAPIDAYWNNSPLKDVANVKTPTLFFVGEKDPRVPMPQSLEMYRALKSNGVPTHLYVAPREPHGWGELRHQLTKLNAEIEWFEKYATKRPFTPERAPGEEKKEPKSSTDQLP